MSNSTMAYARRTTSIGRTAQTQDEIRRAKQTVIELLTNGFEPTRIRRFRVGVGSAISHQGEIAQGPYLVPEISEKPMTVLVTFLRSDLWSVAGFCPCSTPGVHVFPESVHHVRVRREIAP